MRNNYFLNRCLYDCIKSKYRNAENPIYITYMQKIKEIENNRIRSNCEIIKVFLSDILITIAIEFGICDVAPIIGYGIIISIWCLMIKMIKDNKRRRHNIKINGGYNTAINKINDGKQY